MGEEKNFDPPRFWTKQDDEWLKSRWADGTPQAQIARELNRSPGSVAGRVDRLRRRNPSLFAARGCPIKKNNDSLNRD